MIMIASMALCSHRRYFYTQQIAYACPLCFDDGDGDGNSDVVLHSCRCRLHRCYRHILLNKRTDTHTHTHANMGFVLCWPPIQINILFDKFVNKRSHTNLATLIPCIISLLFAWNTLRPQIVFAEHTQSPCWRRCCFCVLVYVCRRHRVVTILITTTFGGPDSVENNYEHWPNMCNGCAQINVPKGNSVAIKSKQTLI